MKSSLVSSRCLLLLCTLLVCALLPSGLASAAEQGSVRVARGAESSFDAYTASPSPTSQSWMRNSYWRMRTYAPYFNSRLSWYGNAWVYQDAYAIYPDSPEAADHPEWILKDPSGNRLWIQFACSGGRCTQYAADIGNPAFRAHWIAAAKARVAAGYKGLFIDDVNMAQRVSDGNGRYTMPLDPRTGTTMDETAWMKHMADFMVEVRAALPGVEIVHNTIWFMGDATADLKRQLNAADYTYIEHGVVDDGIRSGDGRWGFQTLLSFIDRRHAAGHPVILDGYTTDPQWREYSLATYLLINTGSDALGNDAANRPDAFWSGFNVNLGTAQGNRFATGGVWRRDFAGGTVLVNEPGKATQTIDVGPGYRDLDGVARSSVTLAGGRGVVLTKAGSTTTPPPPPQAPTETTLDTTPAPPAGDGGKASDPAPGDGGKPTPPATDSRKTGRRGAKAKVSGARGATATTARVTRVLVHGRVTGTTAGRVKIDLQKRRGKRWVRVHALRTKVSQAGEFSRTMTKLARGSYRVRASYLGTGTAQPSRSSFRRFAVR